MTFQQAVTIMATTDGNRGKALDTIKADVLKHSVKGKGGTITNLGDWLQCQDWDGTETPESIAAEWDALNEEN